MLTYPQEPGMDEITQNPSIKIIKNTKGYNYEYKILSNDVEEMDRLHNAIAEKVKQWEKQEAEIADLEKKYDEAHKINKIWEQTEWKQKKKEKI